MVEEQRHSASISKFDMVIEALQGENKSLFVSSERLAKFSEAHEQKFHELDADQCFALLLNCDLRKVIVLESSMFPSSSAWCKR